MGILSKKFISPFLGFATLTWIIGGTYWYKNQFCDAPILSSNIVAVKSTGTHLPFYFPRGESQPVFTSESFLIFKQTTDFLKDNRSKTLVINGLSAPQEATNNLGLERAKAIKSVLLNLGAIPNSIETKSEIRKNLFFVNQQLFDGVEFKVEDNIEGRFQALNLFFKKNKYQFADNEDLRNYFHSLNNFMSFHSNVKLKITAHRENTEGVAASKKRLAFIRSFLESHDFSSKQIAYEDVNSEMPLGETGNVKNRRVEIRLIVP